MLICYECVIQFHIVTLICLYYRHTDATDFQQIVCAIEHYRLPAISTYGILSSAQHVQNRVRTRNPPPLLVMLLYIVRTRHTCTPSINRIETHPFLADMHSMSNASTHTLAHSRACGLQLRTRTLAKQTPGAIGAPMLRAAERIHYANQSTSDCRPCDRDSVHSRPPEASQRVVCTLAAHRRLHSTLRLCAARIMHSPSRSKRLMLLRLRNRIATHAARKVAAETAFHGQPPASRAPYAEANK